MIKKLIFSIVALVAIALVGLYVFITTIPNVEPKFVSASDVTDTETGATVSLRCEKGNVFDYAYRVNVMVTSEINQQIAYQSHITFNTQLTRGHHDTVKGVATDILVNEGSGITPVEDVFYISRIDEATKYVVFSAYDDLGLAKQHPMRILGQVLKALSIGEEGKRYHFAYDQLQRTYEYRAGEKGLERAAYPTTANVGQFVNTFNDYKSAWEVTVNDSCTPTKVTSVERQGISVGQLGGYIKFEIAADVIPSYTQVEDEQIQDLANADLYWELKQIHDSELQSEIENIEQMWQVMSGFPESKNTAQLIKAANYMIDNLYPEGLVTSLQDPSIDDAVKRDLIFGLGISGNDSAEQYMVDVFNTFPETSDTYDDINKVRLLLALSTNDDISQVSFTQFETIVTQSNQSTNVVNNALISMATAVDALGDKGGDNTAYAEDLKDLINDALENGNESTAIAAIDNANLDDFDEEVVALLASNDHKVRKRAVEHLAEKVVYFDVLIDHLASESSPFVVNAFCVTVNYQALTGNQRSKLENVAANSTGDKQTLINKLLSR